VHFFDSGLAIKMLGRKISSEKIRRVTKAFVAECCQGLIRVRLSYILMGSVL
jgi:hypothetical protein